MKLRPLHNKWKFPDLLSLHRKRRIRGNHHEIHPDQIFLDSENLPDFNQGTLEGRLEKPLPRSVFTSMYIVIFVMFAVLIGQAANLQIKQGAKFAEQSERNRIRPTVLFAARGAVVDRNGLPLISNETSEDGFVRRVYESPGFSHLLGYVSYPKKDSSGNYYETEIKGMEGIESSMNALLAGSNGTLLVEEDARGIIQSQGTVKPPEDGKTLVLSVDARAQRAFYESIKELADRTPFQGAAAVLMDAETGEVYALASYPEYDSNILSSGGPVDVIEGYATDSRQPYLDRAIAGLYTPGSIVKPIEAAGVLADKLISPEKTIYSSGSISIPNPYDSTRPSIFKDWKAHGAVDVRKAIAVSSDVYFYAVGGGFEDQRGLGIDRINYWFRLFGYTTPTGIELPGEASGMVPTPAWKKENFDDEWRIGDTYNTAIGQYGMQVTVLEAARSIAAVANGGKLVKPTILKDAPISGQSIAIDPSALQIAREGMRLGVTEGTSLGLNSLSFARLAGKTGTAQVGVRNEFYNMWAVGFWPYEKPKYIFVVLMDRGPAGTSVGAVSATHAALSKLYVSAPEFFE